MGDTLKIFGQTYPNTNGFKAEDEYGNVLMFTKGGITSIWQDDDGAIVLNDENGNGNYDIFDPSWPSGIVNTEVSTISNILQGKTGLTGINAPNATSVNANAFLNCSSLEFVNMPNVTTLSTGIFNGTTSLKTAHFPKATKITNFRGSGIETLVMPRLTTFLKDAIYLSSLKKLDYGSSDITTGLSTTDYDFDGPKIMQTIILRYGCVVPIQSNTFYNLAFHDSNYPGTLYVPAALVDEYKNATNWSVVLSSYGNQVLPIEGSEYEHYYADGTEVTS